MLSRCKSLKGYRLGVKDETLLTAPSAVKVQSCYDGCDSSTRIRGSRGAACWSVHGLNYMSPLMITPYVVHDGDMPMGTKVVLYVLDFLTSCYLPNWAVALRT